MTQELGTIDAGGDGRDVLLNVINATYGKSYKLEDFDFGKPEFVSMPNPTHNSFVKLGPKAHTGYYGFKTIYYNRIHVSELGAIKVRYENEQYLTQLLDKINTKYGILIQPSDVFEQIITAPQTGTDISLDLQFRPESLVFYGGTKITLGTNDPSIEFESPINLPFANETVFFVHGVYPVGNNIYTEFSSVSLASDYIRQTSAKAISTEDDVFTINQKSKYTQDQYEKLKDSLPFVMTWSPNDGKIIRGLNIYGDVLELESDGSKWNFVVNILGASGNVGVSTIESLKDNPVFKKGAQASNGDLYVIKRDDILNKVLVLKSTDSGSTWSENLVVAGDEHFSRFGLWESTEIKDIVFSNNRLYMLVESIEPYSNSINGNILPPAVEVFNVLTGETVVHPLGDIELYSLDYGLKQDNSIIKFVSSNDNDGLAPDLVGIFGLEVIGNPVAVYFRMGVTSYEALVVPDVDLEPHALTNGYYDILGSKQKLVKSDNYLLSIDVISRIESEEIDHEMYLVNNDRTENGFFNHGVQTLMTVVGIDGISKWSKSVTNLGKGTQPRFITIDYRGLRTNYILQGEVGLFRPYYNEDTNGNFKVTYEHIFKSGSHTGYNLNSGLGAGQHVAMKILESATTTNALSPVTNLEEDKPIITFSFIVKNNDDTYSWLTATDKNQTLTKRTFDKVYSHIGTIPLATASMDGNLYAWSNDGKSIHFSETRGKTWQPYASTLTYYVDSHDYYEGTANLRLKPENFKNASLKNDTLIFEIDYSSSLKVINPDIRNLNDIIDVKDNVLYEIKASEPRDQAIQANGPASARGINVLSQYSPRKIVSWDTDTDNNVLAISNYTTDRDFSYKETLNYDNIDPTFTAYPGYEIQFINFDLVYLGIKELGVLKNEDSYYKLVIVKSDDTVIEHSLFDVDDPFYNFVPTVGFHLWSSTDTADEYTPFVILGFKELILLERVDVNGDFSITRHSLTIPMDNGNELLVAPMFSDNRKDIVLYQKANGIFDIGYTWDMYDRVSTISLVKSFNLSVNDTFTIISGCCTDTTPVEPYGEVKVPVIPAEGTVLDTICRGLNKVEVRANGRLGSYEVVVETNSVDCGYVPPVPGDVGDGGATVNTGG